MNDELLTAFDDGLHELETGVGLDELLSRYPAELAAELRPLFEAAQFARATGPAQPRPEAELSSRARLLALARDARNTRKRSVWGWLFDPAPMAVKRRTFALQLASLVFIVGVTLGSVVTVNAAGSALPGDLLYGIKLAVEDAQLALVPQPAGRQELAAEFEARRIEEAQDLLASRREATVAFTGDIQVISGERWVVGGVPVQVADSLGSTFSLGQRVRVTGRSNNALDAIVAERLELLGIPTLVPTLPAVTETPQPTPTLSVTAEASETPAPTVTRQPTLAPTTAVPTTRPAATATPNTNGPAPSNTPGSDDHGGDDSDTPEPEKTDDSDDDEDDDEDDNDNGGGNSGSGGSDDGGGDDSGGDD